MLNPDTLFGEPIREDMGVRNTYRISFEEVHWLKEGGECTVYGDQARFKTFADCVANTYEQMFKPVLGCNIPLLSAPDNTENCKGRIKLNGSRASDYGAKTFALIDKKLSLYNRYNDCLKPCLEMRAFSRLVKTEYAHGGITITFGREIKIHKYRYAYGLFELVIDVGSSLGLWIGLSALGVFDLILNAMAMGKQRFEQWLHTRNAVLQR